MSKNIELVRKIVALLVITSISMISFAPFSIAASTSQTGNHENILKTQSSDGKSIAHHIFSEAFEKSEAEEKILFNIFQGHSQGTMRAGHLLDDLYSVPPERSDLPYEPPIA